MTENRALLIRSHPSPTDEIYFLTPFSRPPHTDNFALEILNFGEQRASLNRLQKSLEKCSHVIVSRYCPWQWTKYLIRNTGQQYSLIYLVDDDIPAATQTAGLPLSYRMRMKRVGRRQFSEFLRGADRVVVTSRHLAEKYRAPNVVLLQPSNIWPSRTLEHFADPRMITVTFHATAIHQTDLAVIAPAMQKLHDSRPDVQLDIVTDGKIPRCLHHLSRCRIRQDMSWPDFKEFVLSTYSHIGLAPLMDTPYNRGKSHIKMFDITALGAVGVYSNRSPYTDIIDNHKNGVLVEDDVEAWLAALVELVNDPGKAKLMAETAQSIASTAGDPDRLERFWAELLGLTE